MKLRLTEKSVRDLTNIAEYIRGHNPQAAHRVRATILESLQMLTVFPRIGRRQTRDNVRKLVTRRYPYLIYYLVDDTLDEIVILTIQHPARERPHSDA
jgi:plasmid stabilization system protein ParE